MKWLTKTWALLERASVVQRDGRVELKNRGYLVSRNQYNPDQLGGLDITGQWTFATDGDTLSILTRTDGVIGLTRTDGASGGPWGEVQNGLEFCVRAGGPSQGPEIRPRGSVAVDDMVQTGSVTINAGDTVNFHIIDRGTDGLCFTLTNTKDAKRSGSVTSKFVTDCPNGYYHVLFYNHQYADGRDYLSYLDKVAIGRLPHCSQWQLRISPRQRRHRGTRIARSRRQLRDGPAGALWLCAWRLSDSSVENESG